MLASNFMRNKSNLDASSLRARCDGDEYWDLLDIGPQILPLVVYKLLDCYNFPAVLLYNDLEKDTRYCVDPEDVINSLTMQRHNNLLVDINLDRDWELSA
jgi:hypothetical protein